MYSIYSKFPVAAGIADIRSDSSPVYTKSSFSNQLLTPIPRLCPVFAWYRPARMMSPKQAWPKCLESRTRVLNHKPGTNQIGFVFSSGVHAERQFIFEFLIA